MLIAENLDLSRWLTDVSLFPQKFPHFSTGERKTFAGMVASLDESVGNITKALKRNGLYDNSVIVFTTDNGGAPRGFNW